MQKKVLITGASGLIGRQSLVCLKKAGFEVHACARHPHRSVLDPAVQWHAVDLLKGEGVALIEKIKPSHFLHFAWETEHGKFWNAPSNEDWFKSSLELSSSFKKNGGKRFVFAGSCAEYEWTHGVCEEYRTPEVPAHLYGKFKKKFSDYLESEVGFSSSVGRIFLLYGPGENPSRLVPSAIRQLKAHQSLPCTDGNQERDFIYVEDLANAFVTLLDSSVRGKVNLASGEVHTIKSVLLEVAQQLGAPENLLNFGVRPRMADEPDRLLAHVGRLRNELAFRSSYSLITGLRMTIDQYSGGGNLV